MFIKRGKIVKMNIKTMRSSYVKKDWEVQIVIF
jgi:hypothetical protein